MFLTLCGDEIGKKIFAISLEAPTTHLGTPDGTFSSGFIRRSFGEEYARSEGDWLVCHLAVRFASTEEKPPALIFFSFFQSIRIFFCGSSELPGAALLSSQQTSEIMAVLESLRLTENIFSQSSDIRRDFWLKSSPCLRH